MRGVDTGLRTSRVIPGPARNPSLWSLPRWSRPLVLVDLSALFCPRLEELDLALPLCIHPWF